MGWMHTLFQGDIGQNLEIEELQERLNQMRDEKTTVWRYQFYLSETAFYFQTI